MSYWLILFDAHPPRPVVFLFSSRQIKKQKQTSKFKKPKYRWLLRAAFWQQIAFHQSFFLFQMPPPPVHRSVTQQEVPIFPRPPSLFVVCKLLALPTMKHKGVGSYEQQKANGYCDYYIKQTILLGDATRWYYIHIRAFITEIIIDKPPPPPVKDQYRIFVLLYV